MRLGAAVTLALTCAVAVPDAALGQAIQAVSRGEGLMRPLEPTTPPSALRVEGDLDLDSLVRREMTEQGERRVWRLQMKKNQTVRIDLSAEGFDTYLEVFTRDALKPLAENDDVGIGTSTNSRLMFTAPEDGVYYVAASRILGNASGPYEIVVRDRPATPNSVCTIAVGTPLTVLVGTGTGGLDEAKSCFFQGAKGQRLKAETDAKIDSTIEIKLNGGRIGIDDDSGGNGNARLVVTLPSDGRYEVVAAGLFGSEIAGDGGKTAALEPKRIFVKLTELPQPKLEATTFDFNGLSCDGTFTEDNAADGGGRPFAFCTLSRNAGDTFRLSAEWRDSASSESRSISARLGVYTPVGFASLATSVLQTSSVFTFSRDGTMHVRVSAGVGATGAFRVNLLLGNPPTAPAPGER